mgnify:CR=1 FL=1
MEKTLAIYCDRDTFLIQHLANHLENAGIEYLIVGDTATTVLGIDNFTQQTCIKVFQSDFVKAKHIITASLEDSTK